MWNITLIYGLHIVRYFIILDYISVYNIRLYICICHDMDEHMVITWLATIYYISHGMRTIFVKHTVCHILVMIFNISFGAETYVIFCCTGSRWYSRYRTGEPAQNIYYTIINILFEIRIFVHWKRTRFQNGMRLQYFIMKLFVSSPAKVIAHQRRVKLVNQEESCNMMWQNPWMLCALYESRFNV